MARADGPLAIDLSSRRVRLARWLLDGVRQGQPLGALLGYRFERRLHELRRRRAHRRFRSIAPGAARTAGRHRCRGRSSTALDAAAAPQAPVVKSAHSRRVGVAPSDPRRHACRPGARPRSTTAIDAVGDAVRAESGLPAVRGNLARSAGSLDAIASGQAPPPELDVARTPRTGTPVTHRVALLLAGRAAGVDRLGHAGGVAARRGRAGAQRVGGQPAGTGHRRALPGRGARRQPAAWCGRTRFC